jgi:hypothetical protein
VRTRAVTNVLTPNSASLNNFDLLRPGPVEAIAAHIGLSVGSEAPPVDHCGPMHARPFKLVRPSKELDSTIRLPPHLVRIEDLIAADLVDRRFCECCAPGSDNQTRSHVIFHEKYTTLMWGRPSHTVAIEHKVDALNNWRAIVASRIAAIGACDRSIDIAASLPCRKAVAE